MSNSGCNLLWWIQTYLSALFLHISTEKHMPQNMAQILFKGQFWSKRCTEKQGIPTCLDWPWETTTNGIFYSYLGGLRAAPYWHSQGQWNRRGTGVAFLRVRWYLPWVYTKLQMTICQYSRYLGRDFFLRVRTCNTGSKFKEEQPKQSHLAHQQQPTTLGTNHQRRLKGTQFHVGHDVKKSNNKPPILGCPLPVLQNWQGIITPTWKERRGTLALGPRWTRKWAVSRGHW